MTFRTAQCSYGGGRPYNEDSVLCMSEGPVLCAVVADGLGGHGGGEVASGIAAECIAGGFVRQPDIAAEHIRGLFDEANRLVIERQTDAVKMKSTAAALFVNRGLAMWAHAGDSRLYRFEDGALAEQTADHSVSYMAVLSGEIPRSKIRFHEDRNKVLRALGNEAALRTDVSKPLDITEGDQAFLLCTDGFWEYVLEEEMEIELAKSEGPDEWLEGMLARLARRVNGKNDNFSAVAVLTSGVNKR